jgi:hypothetical protein
MRQDGWVSVAPFEPAPEAAPAADGAARRRSILIEAVVCLATAVVIAGLGAPIGLLWRAVAPKVELVQTDFGPYPLQPEPEGYIADEGWFIFIAIGAGILIALLVWFLLRRYRGAAMVAALAVGSVGGSVLAAWLGHRIGLSTYNRLINSAPTGTHIFRPARLRLTDVGLWFGFIPRVRGIVLIQGLVATALYTACAGFSYSPSLRPELDELPDVQLPNWDSPGWQGPTAAPARPAAVAEEPTPDATWPARPGDG